LSGKDNFVNTPSDRYEDSAIVYTRLVQAESQAAAAAVEQIHTAFGSHAALRAALIVTLMKMEVQQNHWLPSIKLYRHLLEDYPEALPSAEYAIECCLKKWAVSLAEANDWTPLGVAAV
jgi:hypothetical protein